MNERYALTRWVFGFTGITLLAISLVLTPHTGAFGGNFVPPQSQTCPLGCSTKQCFRTGPNKCNTPGNECSQNQNKKLCGKCVCTPHDPNPCTCD